MLRLVLTSKKKFSSYFTSKIVVKSTKKFREGKVLSNVGNLHLKTNHFGKVLVNDFEFAGWSLVGIQASKPAQKVLFESLNRMFSSKKERDSVFYKYSVFLLNRIDK